MSTAINEIEEEIKSQVTSKRPRKVAGKKDNEAQDVGLVEGAPDRASLITDHLSDEDEEGKKI